MKKNKLLFFAFGFLFVVVFSYVFNIGVFKHNVSTNRIAENKKVQVTASFYPMYFFATQIGGNKAEVTNITPAGAEPHDYEPTTQEIVRISRSDMLVLNGGKLEAWGDKIKDQLQGSNVLIVAAGENLANKELNEGGRTIQDPHIWLDPVLAKKEVENIGKGYEKVDPKNAAYFQENVKILEDKLDQLDADFKNGLSNCEKKNFITSHEAFGYLAAQYGINQVSISGISPDEEPSPQKLAEITDLVKKEGIKVIFFESLVSPKLSQAIANETKAKILVLDPIEGITPEDLKAGANFFTVMRKNLANLKEALQCKK